ncbi:DUF3850 domain-containing protein [Enterococcus casseliflavus]|uniref:DUF3850 domain-containing protein n=1 Tax=Enterococcus casseliflavus TaxID=37734 RepID=UPI003D6BC2CD
MPRHHNLKILPEYFEAVVSGKKTFEVRKNDRDFQVGDEVLLEEFTLFGGYTGARALVKITYITDYAQKNGFVVFAHELLWHGTKEEE